MSPVSPVSPSVTNVSPLLGDSKPQTWRGLQRFFAKCHHFPSKYKKGVINGEWEGEKCGGTNNGDNIYIYTYSPYIPRGFVSPEGGDKW